MLKYVDTQVTFAEVPDEITLCINITGCKIGCIGCHSPYLAKDIGEELTSEKVLELIDSNKGITCVAFMGGDSSPHDVYNLCKVVQLMRPGIKRAWYSGRQELPDFLDNEKLQRYSYIKLGPYMKDRGPLNDKNTNQRFYEVLRVSKIPSRFILKDITHKFYK